MLAGRVDGLVRSELDSGGAFTTGSWYYRLARAVSAGTGTGTLSGRFGALDPADQVRVRMALEVLPMEIGLLSMRYLVPVMQALRVRRPVESSQR